MEESILPYKTYMVKVKITINSFQLFFTSLIYIYIDDIACKLGCISYASASSWKKCEQKAGQ
jgi:hypothetical protein